MQFVLIATFSIHCDCWCFKIRKLHDGSYALFFIGGWPETPCECGQPDDGTKCPSQRNDAPNVSSLACPLNNWSKATCPDKMPGTTHDCCGPNKVTTCGPKIGVESPCVLNTGCGIATATAKALEGPWTRPEPVVIVDQYTSDNVYCTHTNPSPGVTRNSNSR